MTESERVRIQDGEATETARLAWCMSRPLTPWPVKLGVGELEDGRAVLVVEVRGQPPVAVPLSADVPELPPCVVHMPALLVMARTLRAALKGGA